MKYLNIIFIVIGSALAILLFVPPLAYFFFEFTFSIGSMSRLANQTIPNLMIFAHLVVMAVFLSFMINICKWAFKKIKQILYENKCKEIFKPLSKIQVALTIIEFATCFFSGLCLLFERNFFLSPRESDYGIGYENDLLHLVAVACCFYVSFKKSICLFDFFHDYGE